MPREKRTSAAEVGSGNVFADLGLPNAEELNTKLRLCVVINKILDQRKLTQTEAAQILGVNQPKISALKSYKLEGFSVERLIEHDVVIEIRPRRKTSSPARVLVVGAA